MTLSVAFRGSIAMLTPDPRRGLALVVLLRVDDQRRRSDLRPLDADDAAAAGRRNAGRRRRLERRLSGQRAARVDLQILERLRRLAVEIGTELAARVAVETRVDLALLLLLVLFPFDGACLRIVRERNPGNGRAIHTRQSRCRQKRARHKQAHGDQTPAMCPHNLPLVTPSPEDAGPTLPAYGRTAMRISLIGHSRVVKRSVTAVAASALRGAGVRVEQEHGTQLEANRTGAGRAARRDEADRFERCGSAQRDGGRDVSQAAGANERRTCGRHACADVGARTDRAAAFGEACDERRAGRPRSRRTSSHCESFTSRARTSWPRAGTASSRRRCRARRTTSLRTAVARAAERSSRRRRAGPPPRYCPASWRRPPGRSCRRALPRCAAAHAGIGHDVTPIADAEPIDR